MSVLVPDHKIFSYIHSGLTFAANRMVADEKHSYNIYVHFQSNDVETESKRLVKSWLRMVEQSYNEAYKDTGVTTDLKLKWLAFTPVQLLKYLECVIYQIEKPGIYTPQQQIDFNLLKKWKDDLLNAIISNTEEYKNAKWSEI